MRLMSSRPFGRAFLLALVALLVAPLGAFATTVVDREAYSTTVDAGGGKVTTSLSSEPVNYQTNSGAWKPIDTSLEEQSDGDLHPQSVDGDVAIPDSLSRPIELEHDGHTASFRLLGAAGSADVDGDTASFDSALQGVDATYATRADGVKETLTLATPFSPHAFVYDLTGGSSWSAAVDGADVVLKDGSGVERYRISAPVAWDSAADPAFSNALALSVSKIADGHWHVTLRPDEAWLTSIDRIYPVSIDPDFSWADGTTHFHGAQTCYLASGSQAGWNLCPVPYMLTGYDTRANHALMKFDIASAIPSDATVSSAVFKAYAPPSTTKAAVDHKLYTVTSDWDTHTTWNNRKTGVAWTSAGGDISTNSAYTSSATSVSTNPAWYAWSAPLPTVQGWVAGTLPNYGFLLKTNDTPGDSYGWASTYSRTNMPIYPADSTQWPTLDVTWAHDDVAPDAPASPYVATADFAAQSADVYFTWPDDHAPSSVTPSGTDIVQYRVARRGGAFGSWADLHVDNFTVDDVEQGDQLAVELRARDVAGNVSGVTSKTFTTFSDDSLEDSNLDAMTASFIERYSGVTSQEASSWLAAQGRITEGLQTLDGTAAGSAIAGVQFDNEQRRAHVHVLTDAYNAQIQSILDYLQVYDDYVTIDVVAKSRDELAGAASQLQTSEAALFAAGKVFVGIPETLSGLRVWYASSITAAERQRVEAALDPFSVPYTETATTESSVALPVGDALSGGWCSAQAETVPPEAPVAGSAAEHNFPYWEQEHLLTPFRHLRCSGEFRGGVAIFKSDPEAAPNDYQSTGFAQCTSGFAAVGGQTGGAPYMLTAGHCVTSRAELNENLDDHGNRPWTTRYWYQTGGARDLQPQLIGKVSSEVRYNGYYDAVTPGGPQINETNDWSDVGAIRMTGSGNFADIDQSLIGPWFFRYNEPRTVLTRVRGVDSVKDSERGVASGLWVCVNGARTGLHWSDFGTNNNCGPVLDVREGSVGTVDNTPARTHRIVIDTCSTRPGDSGAAITDVSNRAVGILSGDTHENTFGATKSFDRLEALTGHSLGRCPNGGRGFTFAQPVEEASRDLGMRIMTTRWRPAVSAAAQPTNFSRVTASWNRRVDVDLYVFDEQGHQAGRLTPNGIPNAELLANANRGFGPEEFVERTNAGRTYSVGVCYYSGEGPTRVDVEFRNPDGSTRVVPVTLTGPGNSQIVGATPEGPNVTGIPSNFCSQSGAGGDGRGPGNPGGGWPATCFAVPENNYCLIVG